MRYGVVLFGLCIIILASYKKQIVDENMSLSSLDKNFPVLSYISQTAQAQYPREYKSLSRELRSIQADCRKAPRYVYKPGTADGPISRGGKKTISKVEMRVLTKTEFRLWRERQNFIPDIIQRIENQRAIIYGYLDDVTSTGEAFVGGDIGFDNAIQLRNTVSAFYDYLHKSVEDHDFEQCVSAIANILSEVKDV